ncbi:MAG: 2,3-bisphosphoglycerate-independent phosphoglycerate mutase [Alphaproteobacteria bacterium]|nr:2,3-bisphosphoglycerate-independent phosphoglycerate mutase [Alphaproteobacteria bacterium]
MPLVILFFLSCYIFSAEPPIQEPTHKLMCIVLDGFGMPPEGGFKESAITSETAPCITNFLQKKHATLNASGEAVGLRAGLQGNSEVGHLTIGAGSVHDSIHKQISEALDDESFAKKDIWRTFTDSVLNSNGIVHVFSLLSDGAVHADIDHLLKISLLLYKQNITIKLHAVLDGCDSEPKSAYTFLETIKKQTSFVNICSITGRTWALDRNKDWAKTSKTYKAIIHAEAPTFVTTDEIIAEGTNAVKLTPPHVHTTYKGFDYAKDHFLFLNFRSDRMVQIATALSDENYPKAPQSTERNWLCMCPYSHTLRMPYMFGDNQLPAPLGYILSAHGIRQARIAESEKKAHVTVFFDSHKDLPDNTDVFIAKSNHSEECYNPHPTNEVTELVINAITQKYGFIMVNYAAPDIVGHTGNMQVAKEGITSVDEAIDWIYSVAHKNGYTVIITADHGNAECMTRDERPFHSHTTNLVPFIVVGNHTFIHTSGGLQDIAPTILAHYGIAQPDYFRGRSLCTY